MVKNFAQRIFKNADIRLSDVRIMTPGIVATAIALRCITFENYVC